MIVTEGKHSGLPLLPIQITCQRRGAGIIFAILCVLFLLAAAAAQRAQAQTFTVLHSFKGPDDGSQPKSALLMDVAGNLYGTTESGGAYGYGTVFKLDTSGNVTLLYSFTGGNDGNEPRTGLVRDSAGNFYGTTFFGGTYGWGTVFKIAPSATPPAETVLYSLNNNSGEPAPYGELVIDAAGNLYGTTSAAGSFGKGTVYKVDPSGNETTIYNFTGGSDGATPLAGLLMDSAGNLYGTTELGGAYNYGTVFQLDTSGNETVLYSFAGGSDGSLPAQSPIMDSAGNLYGTTSAGGVSTTDIPSGCGTVFELVNSSGTYTHKVLYQFTGDPDGAGPEYDHLIMDPAGNLYGVTPYGGNNNGTVFKVDLTATPPAETVLHSFAATGVDGTTPYGGLIRDFAGNLYGTTYAAGATSYSWGTVFKVTPPGAGGSFTIEAAQGSSTSATVSSGGTATYDLSVVPSGGFTGTVAFACSDSVSKSACSVTPASVTLSGTSASSAAVKVTTTANAFVVPGPPVEAPPAGRGLWLLLAGLTALLLIAAGHCKRITARRGFRFQRAVLVAVFLGVAAWAACGGSSASSSASGSGGTPIGNYSVTVTGTSGSGSGSLSDSITLTLNVQ